MKDWQKKMLERAQQGLNKIEEMANDEDSMKKFEEKLNSFADKVSEKGEKAYKKVKQTVEEVKDKKSSEKVQEQSSEETSYEDINNSENLKDSMEQLFSLFGMDFDISDEQQQEVEDTLEGLFDENDNVDSEQDSEEENAQLDDDISSILDGFMEDGKINAETISKLRNELDKSTSNLKKLIMIAKAKAAFDSVKSKATDAVDFVKGKYSDMKKSDKVSELKGKYADIKEIINAYNNLTKEDQQRINNDIKEYLHSLASEYRANAKEAKNLLKELNQDTQGRHNVIRDSITENIKETSEAYDRKVDNVFKELNESVAMLELACSKDKVYSAEELYELRAYFNQIIERHKTAEVVFENLNKDKYKKYFDSFNNDTQALYDLIREYNKVAPNKINMIPEAEQINVKGYIMGVSDSKNVDLFKKESVNGYDYIYGIKNERSYSAADIYTGLRSNDKAIFVKHIRLADINRWAEVGRGITVEGRRYEATCGSVIPTVTFEEMRSAMYASQEGITPYYEEGISTDEEINKVIDYTMTSLGLGDNQKQYQI